MAIRRPSNPLDVAAALNQVRAGKDNLIERSNQSREAMIYPPASRRIRCRLGGMTNICELLINSVKLQRAKGAARLEPKGA